MNKRFHILWVVFTLFCSVLNAQIIKLSQPVRLGIELKSIYDDNIYLYSQDYLQDFKNQIRSYRFPINTYDDFITNINLSLRISYTRTSNVNFYFKQFLYSVNSEKSYQTISATINQKITKPINLKISYLYLPRFLIRYYRDPFGTSTKYIQCSFAEHLFTFGADYTIKDIKLSPFIRYEIDDYVKNFNYYDGYAIRFGADFLWTINLASSEQMRGKKQTNIKLGFESKQNKADGPVPDISYNDNSVSLEFETRIPAYEKIGVLLGAEYSNRNFTTSNSANIDPYHRDRIDKKLQITSSIIYYISNRFQLYLNYEYESRKVTSPSLNSIEDIKDYQNNRVLLGFKLGSIKLN